jgi:ribonuclease HI
MVVTVNTDGGARGNPGPGAIGVVIKNEKKEKVREIGKFIGKSTNNEAEYKAVIEGLKACEEMKVEQAEFFIDSLLVVSQLNGDFKIKEPRMKALFKEAKDIEKNIKSVKYTHVKREKNSEPDKIVNDVLDSLE